MPAAAGAAACCGQATAAPVPLTAQVGRDYHSNDHCDRHTIPAEDTPPAPAERQAGVHGPEPAPPVQRQDVRTEWRGHRPVVARDASSQVEIDGRVDEYGSTRIRGKLNPFVLADNTDLNVVFKNVDMVSASPYSMKFAGYRIAEGKISLDLQYKVRHSQLEGNNQIVLDKLTLGERIDSP
jgi:hypothetical protein